MSQALVATTLDQGSLEPSFAKIVWDVNRRPVVQSVAAFKVPKSLQLNPIRRIGTYPGAPNRISMYPVVRDGRAFMLSLESRLEGFWARLFNMHASVTAIYAQPFALIWEVDRRAVVRLPDFLLRTTTGWVVVDVKPEEHLARDPHAQSLFELTRRTVAVAGARYLHVGDLPRQAQTNIDTIARYKPVNAHLLPLMRTVALLRPAYAGSVIELCGDLGPGREVLFTLIANGLCEINFAQPLSAATRLIWTRQSKELA